MLIHLSLSPSPSIASPSDVVIFCLASSQLIYPSIWKTMNRKSLHMIFFFFCLRDLTECSSKARELLRDTV